jgi:hypothetical protein
MKTRTDLLEEKEEEMKRKMGRRRRLLTGAGLTAGVLAVAAVAWACTVQIGTLTVCAPIPVPTYVEGRCAKKANTNGTGSQVGSISVSKTGSAMSVMGERFVAGDRYSIEFASPRAVLNGLNCHADNPSGGVTSLLGYAPGSTQPNTVLGPAWAVGATSPNVTTGLTPHTGTAKVCVQDYPNRVNGTQVVLAVV